jgi:hypothetical protein
VKQKLVKGINEISNSDYHGDKGYLSSSTLKLLLKDRQKFYDQVFKGIKPEYSKSTLSAFDEGSFTHTMILEPHLRDKEYAFFPEFRKQGKEWEEFKENNPDKILISKPQLKRVEKLLEAYKGRPEAVKLIKNGFPEHTVAGEIMGIPCKARADFINVEEGYIVDVKTTAREANLETFKFTCADYGYYFSAAMYCELFKQEYDKEFDFYFIVLSKKDYNCEVFKLSQDSKDLGKNLLIKSINLYKLCKETGNWINPKKEIVQNGTYEILEV